jgi:NAD(P)-dependent dehydrogenase (short-subunit alcohol dehydrogenase family)
MADDGELSGLTALVTGGASGIGLATVEALTERGARVAVIDRDPSEAPTVISFQADLGDDMAARLAVAAAIQALGGLDVLINNVGIGAQGTIEANSDEEWHRVFDINVVSMVRVSRAALPALRRSEHAAIVNTCSVAATVGLPQRALYSATKGAVLSLTLAMAADHLHEGIRVNCVNPGTADTPWIGRLLAQAADPDTELAALVARQPHGRLVSAAEVAAAIVFLASPASGSTTGVAFPVDGGMAAGLRVAPGTGS